MSQVDNRNSSVVKRARTEGSHREDDWTCPSCGNVNFSFRTTCNMRNCTQPRLADHNAKSAARLMQTPPSYSSLAPYVGSGAPYSMYMGVPPYGSPFFNGSSIPPYDVPFSGGSSYHYGYGSRLSAGSPYRPPHMTGPPYSSGSVMGNGGMYGMPPMMDILGMPMGPAAMCPGPGSFPDDKSMKMLADATRGNDWTCPKCGNINFSFRTFCNVRKCNTPKPGSQSDITSKPKMPEGSWKCEKCNNINYPFRTKCNRQNCGAEKPAEVKTSPSPAPYENEQALSGINLMGISDVGRGSTPFKGGIELSSGSKSAIVTNTTVEIIVPENAYGAVRGENGSNLARLRQISGAKVIVHEPCLGTSDRIVVISGMPDETQAAQSLLQAFMLTGQS